MAVLYARRRGIWVAASKVWKKKAGAWAELADVSSLEQDYAWYQSNSKTVNITGTGNSAFCYVKISGTTHAAEASITVDRGTEVQCHVEGGLGTGGNIYLNGTKVSSSDYTYTVTGNCTIKLSFNRQSTYVLYSSIYITTEQE